MAEVLSAPALRAVAALGLEFPGPVGLAAGYDRTGRMLPFALAHGFGFVELGTMTPMPVPGHNPGVSVLADEVARWRQHARRPRCLVGINLGRQPDAPLCSAAHDFEIAMRTAWQCADYLTINLSGAAGRMLLQPDAGALLQEVLARVREQQAQLARASGKRVSVLLKCNAGEPDADSSAWRWLRDAHVDGLVAAIEAPGAPLRLRRRVLERLAACLDPSVVLIAAGGIRCAEDARAYLRCGAKLLQVYGVYAEQGPGAIAAINAGLVEA